MAITQFYHSKSYAHDLGFAVFSHNLLLVNFTNLFTVISLELGKSVSLQQIRKMENRQMSHVNQHFFQSRHSRNLPFFHWK